MIRNAKVLGLAIVAALALTAVMASAASATNFTAASYPVKISGTQSESHKFTVGGGTVTCTTATFSGEATAASETLTMVPTYSNCTAFGFVGAKVTGFSSTGCDYTFYSGGNVDLDCASGHVTIDAGDCTVTLEPGKNQSLHENVYTNNTPTSGKVTVHSNVTGIHATVIDDGFCVITPGTYTNATYTGTTVVEGKNSKGVAVAIDVN
jgi:hypothetical protein